MFGEDFKTSVFGFAMCMAGCECAQAYLVLSYKVLLPYVVKKIFSFLMPSISVPHITSGLFCGAFL